MKIALIGLRGTGKSTVGKLLAQRLSWAFFDTDVIVQERAGMTIRELFESRGETEFRKIESAVVVECSANDRCVIASGGGAVLDPANVSALKKDSFVAHLTADPTELWRRISLDCATHHTRPKLAQGAESGIDELKKLLLARAALYAQARDVEVSVEDRTPDEVVQAIMILLKAHGALKGM